MSKKPTFTFDPRENRKTLNDLHKWALDFCAQSKWKGQHTYKLIFRDGDKETTTEYENRPCWGEMRMYEKTHPKEVKDGVHMPGDLSIRFPDGKPVAVCVAFPVHQSEAQSQYREWIFSGNSPWRSAFQKIEFGRDDKGLITSLAILDTRIDPTVMVSGLMASRYTAYANISEDPNVSFLIRMLLPVTADKMKALQIVPVGNAYTGPTQKSNVVRLLNGHPRQISVNSNSFYDRGVYNRPEIQNLFNDGEHSLFDIPWFKENQRKIVPFETVINEAIPELLKYGDAHAA